MDRDLQCRLERIESVIKDSLPADMNSAWKKLSFSDLPSDISPTYIAQLISPCKNLIDIGGKRWRPLLLVLCAEAVSVGNEQNIKNAYSITPLVEFAHTASLIHDDIEDNADIRRGMPAAHVKWGIDAALNAGSWMYFEATACIDKLSLPEHKKLLFYALYERELRRLHLGQAMDIMWHQDTQFVPTVEEYLSMVRCKTGTLSSLASQVGVLAGEGDEETAIAAGKIAAEIGIGFQILDDVQNITSGNSGKKRGDDIVEGKKSMPVLLHLMHNPKDKQKVLSLMKDAKAEGIDSPAVESCIRVLESGNAIQDAFIRGRNIVKEKTQELEKLLHSDNKLITKLFDSMLPNW